MKKRVLLLNSGVTLPPGCPPIPDPNNYPDDASYEAAMDQWHSDFDAWVDAGKPDGGPCGNGEWEITYYDKNGNKYTVNQDSTQDEMDHYRETQFGN
jgi:hypothetical protein